MKLSIVTLLLLVALSFCAFAQEFQPDLSQWDISLLRQAKTSSFGLFTPMQSGQVIFYCNLARMDGALFVKTILKPYLEAKGDTEFSEYKQSLVNDLNSLRPLKPLKSNVVLNIMAKSYARSSGKKGIVGHERFDQRFWLLERLGRTVGENCDYGEENPLDVVISLLIDDGVENLGHRYNILSRQFSKVGVGSGIHTEYGIDYVMDFSGQ